MVVNSGSLENEEDPEAKEKGADYAKLAKALGEIVDQGIQVSLVDINKSEYGFIPDVENHQILFGLKALSGVNGEVIDQIIAGRPYANIKDFMARTPIKKTAMVALIKGGAFDEISQNLTNLDVDPRIAAMAYFISIVSNPKKKLTLQNFNGLINYGIVPDSLALEKRVYFWTKQLRKQKTNDGCYWLDEQLFNKISQNFNIEPATIHNGKIYLYQKEWDILYNNQMDNAREWLKSHQDEILFALNKKLFIETWEKYASGNLSSWEMDALCFYYNRHELADIDNDKYGISDFFSLSRTPIVAKTFKKAGKSIPIFELTRIAGTVISKNDNRHSISLLTTTGVVNVKFTKEYYAMFKRQISEIQPDGTKKVIEKGWFTKGKKLLITGFRREDTFVAKKYSSTGGHQLYLITGTNGKNINITSARAGSK